MLIRNEQERLLANNPPSSQRSNVDITIEFERLIKN